MPAARVEAPAAAAAPPAAMPTGAVEATPGAPVLVAAAIALAPRLPTVLTPLVATEPATFAAWVTALLIAGLFTTAPAAARAVCTGSPLPLWKALSALEAASAEPAPLAIGGGLMNSPGVITVAVVAAS